MPNRNDWEDDKAAPRPGGLRLAAAACALAASAYAAPAHAEIVLSQVIVDLHPGQPPREDVEIWNNGPERAFVVAEPAEIVSPGLAGENRAADPDPERLGLLVTPSRMVLEPGQRRLLRVAAIASSRDKERIYRVTVKPVAGGISAEQTALKILVGFDMLVIIRPTAPVEKLSSVRDAAHLTIRNEGNTNAEIFDGRRCDSAGKNCTEIPGKRLYAGASWQQKAAAGDVIEYSLKTVSGTTRRRF